jgi:hypothetical protein
MIWTAKKLWLDMEIDTILKSNEASRPKKRKKEDDLDQFADTEVSQLREETLNADELDEQANREKLPVTAATLKLKLLPKVMGALRRCVLYPQSLYGNTQFSTAPHVHRSSFWQSIVNNNLLEGARRWLEPPPDRSRPAPNIQREIFSILPTLDIDTAVLKESKLGLIVLFYTKCKRVTLDLTRTADALVSDRSASYRDRAIPTADMSTGDGATHERLNVILARAKEGEWPAGAHHMSDSSDVIANFLSSHTSSLSSAPAAPLALVCTCRSSSALVCARFLRSSALVLGSHLCWARLRPWSFVPAHVRLCLRALVCLRPSLAGSRPTPSGDGSR